MNISFAVHIPFAMHISYVAQLTFGKPKVVVERTPK